ncbi:hypothetical protein [Caballeronia sp. LZ001]|nr:hypothetical protein [Caballeronia sp. LZ001]MDR5799057.1 hypothetical protein [Caballeronia sp. LZ001]
MQHRLKSEKEIVTVSNEAAALGFESDKAMHEHVRWLNKHGTREYHAWFQRHREENPIEIRPLNQTEIIRLESAIANETKCSAGGRAFSEYDLEQEGRWVMGCGQYMPSYNQTALTGDA